MNTSQETSSIEINFEVQLDYSDSTLSLKVGRGQIYHQHGMAGELWCSSDAAHQAWPAQQLPSIFKKKKIKLS